MSEEITVTHTRVFAADQNGGNPCPVILDADRLDDGVMQRVARTFGLDTAFVLRPTSQTAAFRVRYFVPGHEMGVSGHATIAAVTVALRRGGAATDSQQNGALNVETSSGIFEIQWTRQAQDVRMTLAQNPPDFGAFAPSQDVARVLGISVDDIDTSRSPVQSVSVSRPKLLIPLRDWRTLNRLSPRFDALWQLCDVQHVSGLYPFSRHTDKANVDAEARQFPYRAGFAEDAATGVAAGALGAYLAHYDKHRAAGRHGFRIAQGYAMGAPSLIEAFADCADGVITHTAIRGVAHVLHSERLRG